MCSINVIQPHEGDEEEEMEQEEEKKKKEDKRKKEKQDREREHTEDEEEKDDDIKEDDPKREVSYSQHRLISTDNYYICATIRYYHYYRLFNSLKIHFIEYIG